VLCTYVDRSLSKANYNRIDLEKFSKIFGFYVGVLVLTEIGPGVTIKRPFVKIHRLK